MKGNAVKSTEHLTVLENVYGLRSSGIAVQGLQAVMGRGGGGSITKEQPGLLINNKTNKACMRACLGVSDS
jgi:hypothetical protein